MKRLIKNLNKLKEPAEPITFINTDGKIDDTTKQQCLETVDNLKAILTKHPEYLALSAPQIGVNKRIVCIKFDNAIKTFINPIVTKKSKYTIAIETFVSMADTEILVTRPEEIITVYYNENFKYEDNKLLGQAAKIFDQQTQLLDGVLPSDIGLVSNTIEDGKFADLSEEELKEAINIYKQYIAVKAKTLETEIKKDELLDKQYKQLKFTEGVITDKIQVIENPSETKTTAPLNRAQRRSLDKVVKAAKKKGK